LKQPPPFRIGLGFDTHRLADGGGLRLGGVDLPFPRHLVGHSDADVLLHAITDAVLGAAAAGDIGQLFPNTDPVNRGRNSRDFLQAACQIIRQAGWEIGNIDCVVSAQRPKLIAHLGDMTASIAEIMGIEANRIGLKGKTGENVGPVGREEAIEARCVALIYLN
jgi:2-C-methyl-D-erythritol 2,4-cyclodiphosphate synthase